MKSSRIPKKNKVPKQNRIPAKEQIVRPGFISEEDTVKFSFSALERTKYFNLDSTCPNWSSELFDMLKNVSNCTKVDLISGKLQTYRVHDHCKASPPNPLPDGVALKDCYQIRISKSKGGIHGVFYENVFYVIWLDPLHNMYPDYKYGGLKVISPPKTCCMEREDTILELQGQIAQLKEECHFWEQEASKSIDGVN